MYITYKQFNGIPGSNTIIAERLGFIIIYYYFAHPATTHSIFKAV